MPSRLALFDVASPYITRVRELLEANPIVRVGIYCGNRNLTSLPRIAVHNSRIHNHALYGLVLQNVDAEVVNTEVSNCASYCVYLSGGEQRFVHSTISSYFNSTNVRIQTIPNKGLSAVYVDNADRLPDVTESFLNGVMNENLFVWRLEKRDAGTLRAIRYANDRIADPVLSEKIDHLETVAGRIFREIEQHPEKQAQAWGKAAGSFAEGVGMYLGLPVQGIKELGKVAGVGDGDGSINLKLSEIADNELFNAIDEVNPLN